VATGSTGVGPGGSLFQVAGSGVRGGSFPSNAASSGTAAVCAALRAARTACTMLLPSNCGCALSKALWRNPQIDQFAAPRHGRGNRMVGGLRRVHSLGKPGLHSPCLVPKQPRITWRCHARITT
jgi:hypothetical protein